MGVSKQVTFSLACAVALSAVIPGIAGYLSARIESIEAAERKLHAQELRLNARLARETRQVAYPAPCEGKTVRPARELPPAAFVPAPEYKPDKGERPPVVPPPAWLRR
ncbi:hypothetical protein [Nonomuraea typhae]|uniref:hypothetical protein n=1 Tax=Nonomuraea typhae TaxID=2603600 RepID=UPI0012F88DC7|nr:hypothetical protein [Nonomuraea typhae]